MASHTEAPHRERPADAVMDARTLTAVRMPNRDALVVNDCPEAEAARCTTDCRK